MIYNYQCSRVSTEDKLWNNRWGLSVNPKWHTYPLPQGSNCPRIWRWYSYDQKVIFLGYWPEYSVHSREYPESYHTTNQLCSLSSIHGLHICLQHQESQWPIPRPYPFVDHVAAAAIPVVLLLSGDLLRHPGKKVKSDSCAKGILITRTILQFGDVWQE